MTFRTMIINPGLLLASALFLAACGGSEGGLRGSLDNYNEEKTVTEPEIPPIDCSGVPDLSDAIVTGIKVAYQTQGIYAADDREPERHRLSIWFIPTYTQPAQARIGSWFNFQFSLFPMAAATSCAPSVLEERLVAVSLTSDSDFHAEYPAGSELSELFGGDVDFGEEGQTITDSEAGLWQFTTIELPTESPQHRFTLTVTLDSGAEHSLTLDPIVFPETLPAESDFPSEPMTWTGANSGYLNDSGVLSCVDETADADYCSEKYPLQDADIGRDALARAGNLTKVGAGSSGFDFTKLDAQGDTLPVDANQWSCVRDNHTGRVWEVKTESGLRDKDYSYRWYLPDDSRNGGNAGAQGGGQCGDSLCDTHSYVEALNDIALCGINQWRLPSRADWLSLINYGDTEHPLNADYFPNAPNHYAWSATPYANDIGRAWAFSDNVGGLAALNIEEPNIKVRLVAGGRLPAESANSNDHCNRPSLMASTHTEDFDLLGNAGVVRHLTTNLEWQRCSAGQQWDGSECTGFAKVYTWQQALNLVRTMPGWRLPNIRELTSLQEVCSVHPTINETVFPNTPFTEGWFGLNYWSATPSANDTTRIHTADFDAGGIGRDSRYVGRLGSLGRVRLVRDVDAQ